MQQGTGLGMSGEGGEDQQIIDFLRRGEIVTVLNQPRVSDAYYRRPLTSMRVVEFNLTTTLLASAHAPTRAARQLFRESFKRTRLNSTQLSPESRSSCPAAEVLRRTGKWINFLRISELPQLISTKFNPIDVQRSGAN
jgi:hypothetical protein